MKQTRWECGEGHVFTYGDEDWHHELNQGFIDKFPIPMYCQYESCMDSSHLIPVDI